LLNDFAIVSWYDTMVTLATLAIVEPHNTTALSLWHAIRSVFHDNRDTRATYLRDEFHGFNQGDLSVVDYTSKMKEMADTLSDLGSRVRDHDLVHNVLCGLNEQLQHAVSHVTRDRLPTFIKLRSFLLLEEQRLGRRARVVAHNALLAQAHLVFQAAGAPMPAYTNPAPPPYFNLTPAGFYGAGASHAGPSTAPGQGKKKKKKGTAAPAPFAPPFTGARPPAPRPSAPALLVRSRPGPALTSSVPPLVPVRPPRPRRKVSPSMLRRLHRPLLRLLLRRSGTSPPSSPH
jgi:hypothetical protein